MKKFILAAALVAAMAPAAVAQDEFAPEKGDFGVELHSILSRTTTQPSAIASMVLPAATSSPIRTLSA